MQRRSDERKGDLRNASVLEVIVAIIIVLVILLHSNNLKFGDQIDNLVEKIDLLTETNVALKQRVSTLEKSELVLKKEANELREKIAFYESILEAENGALAIIEKLESENIQLTEVNKKLKEKIEILEDQLQLALEKLKADGKGGIDKPFCRLPVLDSSIKQTHKWLGQVSWSTNGIEFIVDPKLEKAMALMIPGVKELELGSPLSNGDFTTAARLAFTHSKRQDPECRYNVIIKVGPDDPASFILLVEKYFYKRVI